MHTLKLKRGQRVGATILSELQLGTRTQRNPPRALLPCQSLFSVTTRVDGTSSHPARCCGDNHDASCIPALKYSGLSPLSSPARSLTHPCPMSFAMSFDRGFPSPSMPVRQTVTWTLHEQNLSLRKSPGRTCRALAARACCRQGTHPTPPTKPCLESASSGGWTVISSISRSGGQLAVV